MSAQTLIQTCRDRGIALTVAGDRIRAAGQLDASLVADLRAHKGELLALLASPPALSPAPPADIPARDTYTAWLLGVVVPGVDAVALVHCADCRHCDANPHTPAQGWCLCRAGSRANGWPTVRHCCGRFEPKGRADG